MRLRRGEGTIVSVEGPLAEHLLAQGFTPVPNRTAKILPASDPEPPAEVEQKEKPPPKSRTRRG